MVQGLFSPTMCADLIWKEVFQIRCIKAIHSDSIILCQAERHNLVKAVYDCLRFRIHCFKSIDRYVYYLILNFSTELCVNFDRNQNISNLPNLDYYKHST